MALASLVAGCSLAADVTPPPAAPGPTRTPHPCKAGAAPAVEQALKAYRQFNDAIQLTSDTMFAADGDRNSAALTTAMAELYEAKRVVDSVSVPVCLNGLASSLKDYSEVWVEFFRDCIYQGECIELSVLQRESGEAKDDFLDYVDFGTCVDEYKINMCEYPAKYLREPTKSPGWKETMQAIYNKYCPTVEASGDCEPDPRGE